MRNTLKTFLASFVRKITL